MLRNVAAIIVGMIVGMLLNGVVISISSTILYPAPEGFDWNDAVQMQQYIRSLPTGAFLVAILAHTLQAGVGGWLAARLCASRPLVLAGAIGAITLAGSIFNLLQMPAPSWMWLEVPLLLVVSWRVGLMEQTRRAALEHAKATAD